MTVEALARTGEPSTFTQTLHTMYVGTVLSLGMQQEITTYYVGKEGYFSRTSVAVSRILPQ